VFEPAVDRFGWAVAGAGAFEVGEDVDGVLGQGPSEGDEFAQRVWDSVTDRVDQLLHQLPSPGSVGFAVGGDHALVDAPGDLDLDVRVGLEQMAPATRAMPRIRVRLARTPKPTPYIAPTFVGLPLVAVIFNSGDQINGSPCGHGDVATQSRT